MPDESAADNRQASASMWLEEKVVDLLPELMSAARYMTDRRAAVVLTRHSVVADLTASLLGAPGHAGTAAGDNGTAGEGKRSRDEDPHLRDAADHGRLPVELSRTSVQPSLRPAPARWQVNV